MGGSAAGLGRERCVEKWPPIIRRTPIAALWHVAQQLKPRCVSDSMDNDLGIAPPPDEPVDPARDLPAEPEETERGPSRWLVLAFVALLSTLVLLGTTGIGAAASSLLGGGANGCGGG